MIKIGSVWELPNWNPPLSLIVIVTNVDREYVSIRYLYDSQGHYSGREEMNRFLKYYVELIY